LQQYGWESLPGWGYYNMRNRLVILIAVNVILVGATIVLLRMWMVDQTPETAATAMAATPEAEVLQVLVAAENLNSGVLMQKQHWRWQPWPEDGLSKSYVSYNPEEDTEETAEALEEELVGSVVRFGIPEGQPLVTGAIVKPGDRGFLSAILEPGYRAISIPVTASTSNAGLILPGDYVDVIMSHKFKLEADDGKRYDRRVAETILQNIRTLAIDQNFSNDTSGAKVGKTATLQVSPRDAERVALALNMGELSLSLRGIDAQNSPGDARRTATWDYNASVALRAPGSAKDSRSRPDVVRGGKKANKDK
jgi:pilus assembly protein CpaB